LERNQKIFSKTNQLERTSDLNVTNRNAAIRKIKRIERKKEKVVVVVVVADIVIVVIRKA